MRGLVLGALMACGCAGDVVAAQSQAVEREPDLVIRCSGVLPDSPVGFWYSAELMREGQRWVPQDASGRVFIAGEAGEADGADGHVSVALDWRGEENGGEFEMSPLGATLRVQYFDPDGNVEWSYPACFPQ